MARGSTPPPESGESAAPGVAAREELEPIGVEAPSTRRILVTGGSGFMGSHLLPRLVSRGHRVRATWRGREGPGRVAAPGVEWRLADVTERDALADAAFECDAVVHLAGARHHTEEARLETVNVAGTRNVLDAAKQAGAERFVYVSALGASPAAGDYFRSRFQAEDAVMASGLDYVILRPGVVYGPSDHFVTAIIALLRSLPVFPMLGDGTFRLQPLAVEDLVDTLSQAVERPDVGGGLYELAGPDRLSFTRIVRIVGEVAGCVKPVLPLPDVLAATAVAVARRLGIATPFTREQLDVLRWGSVLSGRENPLVTAFRVKPLPFRDALVDYLAAGMDEGRGPRREGPRK